MATTYKLRSSLLGHEKDVRAVTAAIFPEGAIISGSRDVTSRVWVPNDFNSSFTEGHIMSGHNNFVSCVCVMPPSDKFPQGLIMTGSNDHDILAYTLESPHPVFKLQGHEDTVCALAAGKFGTLLSGSWDKTAKVWLNQKCVMTLKGHDFAVWAVAVMPEQGMMLTGSADKTIKMWKAGKCERTFTGHTDCVRGLTVLSALEFLSCSNDATIRRWITTGECVQTYSGHTNFVYSIAALPNGQDFVSVGEDRTLRVWTDGTCSQTITHPATSVWSVTTLPNGDIATGSSDGVIRVFTKDPSRMSSEEEQKAFEEEVAASTVPQQVGDVKLEDLPGPEVLQEPGSREGQTKMIRKGNKMEVYQWSSATSQWSKIGDVVGASGGSQATSGKTLYEGKEYDYVFTVELDDSDGPPLKLPYNLSEDPWHAAQNFIHKNNLSQMALDQVANFIIKNTESVTLGQQQIPQVSDPFTGGGRYIPGSSAPPGVPTVGSSDPFTGGGRYIPGSSAPPGVPTVGSNDPFTGGGRYIPGTGDQNFGADQVVFKDSSTNNLVNQYFPKKECLSFDQANPNAILGKIKEFNSTLDASHMVEESQLDQLASLKDSGSPTAQHLELMWKLLHWPTDKVFPVLDVLRLGIRNPVVNQHFCNQKDGPQFLQYILSLGSHDKPTPNQMLVWRTVCNAFKQKDGEVLLLAHRDAVLTSLVQCKDNANKNIQIAASSVLLNYAVVLHTNNDVEARAQCLAVATEIASIQTDPEANFRLLVCFGTLLWEDLNSKELAKSLGVVDFVKRTKSVKDPHKVGQCAGFLGNVLK